MTGGDLSALVGQRIRDLRVERGLSLSSLAAAAGIGKGSLSELETGSRNPTLSTLYALAGPLGVPLAALLLERVGSEVSSDGVTGRLLEVRRGPEEVRELYTLDLASRVDRVSPAHGPGVTEVLTVTSGRIQAGPLDQLRSAGAGQTISWVSDREHRYRTADQPVEAILVVLTPPPG